MIDKIHKLLCKYLLQKQFVFRFQTYDGQGETVLNDSEVVEYTFINSGNSHININGLIIPPSWNANDFGVPDNGIILNRIRLAVNENEMDVTVYKFNFFVPVPLGFPQVDSLQVIFKCKATVRTKNP